MDTRRFIQTNDVLSLSPDSEEAAVSLTEIMNQLI